MTHRMLGCAMALSAASFATAQTAATQPAVSPTDPRLITLKDFPDSGLATGPHTVWVYLPKDYQTSDHRYRVIYFHDGREVLQSIDASVPYTYPTDPNQRFDETMRADVAYDQLMERGLIHPAILVAIGLGPKGPEGRVIELTPASSGNAGNNGGGHHGSTTRPSGQIEGYFKYIATQIKPYIDSHYRTMPEPEYTGIAGQSLGGLATFYIAYHHPEVFGMAGCMSSSLWWDKQAVLKAIATDNRPRTPVRFWLQGGSCEGDKCMWQDSMTAAATLVKKGWREGDDLAFFLDYAGRHAQSSWAHQAAPMLHFLLRKQQPQLTGASLKLVTDADGRPIRLMQALDKPYVTMELHYTDGLRLNACSPAIASENPQVVTVDLADYGRMDNHGRGLATLTGRYAGYSVSQTVIGFNNEDFPKYSRLVCPRTNQPLPVDGTMDGWRDIPFFPLTDTPTTGMPPRRFAVSHDEQFVYVAVEVTDPHVVAEPGKAPWQQDGVEVRLDARSDPARYYGRGDGEGRNILLLAACPSADKPIVHEADKLPKGVKVVCKPTATGYVFQAAIPADYLNGAGQATWQEFRLNVCVDDVDKPGVEAQKHWWQPDWRTDENRPGAGTFKR